MEKRLIALEFTDDQVIIKEIRDNLRKMIVEITVGSKIIRALAVILAIFLWLDCQFLSSDA